ncbi:hypothetical protein LEP48_16380 [Isoptericola sp. NEAU-Y5]|uniref:Uncharacterized protein n=1 Tax=Isoptericola luteus TaxID=2879484 RepID=A0ABS7ZJ21_9MICO|nr:hypothetical protein [Isoptericola sp. NEAU-Y5]MCA5894913.1 hypothetical protein [Isoptericola sp. NEAU-Y5]
MPMVHSTDADFKVSRIDLGTLVDFQRQAEEHGWATRWTAVDALRTQVAEGSILLQPLLREERAGVLRAYRCLVLFSAADGPVAGGVATIDLSPEAYSELDRIDHDPEVRSALARVFALASGGIAMVSKS